MKEALIIACYAVALVFIVPVLLVAYILGKGGDQSEMNIKWDLGAE